MHHSAHQTPGSAFFNPRLRFSLCPARFACSKTHPPPHPPPPLSTCNPRPCIQAVYDSPLNIPCHGCFPGASPSVSLSADLASTQDASHFLPFFSLLDVSTISGWLAKHHILAMPALLHSCDTVCMWRFLLAYVHVNISMLPFLRCSRKRPCHTSIT